MTWLVVSVGDYNAFTYRKLWFKLCYGRDVELWEIIGKKKFKKLEIENLKTGEKPLKKLNHLPIPVFTITGNVDRTKWKHDLDEKKPGWKWPYQDLFNKSVKNYKNIKNFDYSYAKFGEYIFIGYPKSSFPGRVKSKAYKRNKAKLEKLFDKFRNENKDKKVIFVSHNVPYNTKLDKITIKEAHKKVRGKHYGAKMTRRIIEKYQPILTIAGHIHENQGTDKIGRTLIVNTGASYEGKMAIIDISKDNRIEVKLIK